MMATHNKSLQPIKKTPFFSPAELNRYVAKQMK